MYAIEKFGGRDEMREKKRRSGTLMEENEKMGLCGGRQVCLIRMDVSS